MKKRYNEGPESDRSDVSHFWSGFWRAQFVTVAGSTVVHFPPAWLTVMRVDVQPSSCKLAAALRGLRECDEIPALLQTLEWPTIDEGVGDSI